jgi:hypothetical protein
MKQIVDLPKRHVEKCRVSIAERFLFTLRFWKNNDHNLFKNAYSAYHEFVTKILLKSIDCGL